MISVMRTHLRSTAINLGVLVCTLLLIWIAAEVLLRITYIQPMGTRAVPLHRPAHIEELVYELRPNVDVQGFGPESITTNADGFRGELRTDNRPLIAVVGDSYTFGHGVNDHETNPYYLQQEVPSHFVLNAGVDGYNIEQEALVMQHKVKAMNPDIVVIEFVFNDMLPKGVIYEDGTINVGVGTETEQDEKVKEAITKQGLINFPGKFFLQKHSAVFNFIERTTKNLPFRTKVVDTEDTITPTDLAFYETWFTELDKHVETDKKLFLIWPESNWHEPSRAFLSTLATKHGYTVIDLYDHFGNGYAHLGWDYHPKASVHKEVAALLAERMKEMGWVENL